MDNCLIIFITISVLILVGIRQVYQIIQIDIRV